MRRASWVLLAAWCGCVIGGGCTTEPRSSPGAVLDVYFSPNGGCTQAVVRELTAATASVRIQAYSFTSAPIAQAVVEARRRGVAIEVVLDKSNRTDKYTAATFLRNQGVDVRIDARHAIAHNKVMIIDDRVVITGSFNFTRAAEERNAENLLIIRNAPGVIERYLANFRTHQQHSEPYEGPGRPA